MGEDLTDDEVLDLISDKLALESWFEGKTLTVMLPDRSEGLRLAKFRLVRVTDRPTTADLRGETV